jgi:hypothetical protein
MSFALSHACKEGTNVCISSLSDRGTEKRILTKGGMMTHSRILVCKFMTRRPSSNTRTQAR